MIYFSLLTVALRLLPVTSVRPVSIQFKIRTAMMQVGGAAMPQAGFSCWHWHQALQREQPFVQARRCLGESNGRVAAG
jgi:hypothetical protein